MPRVLPYQRFSRSYAILVLGRLFLKCAHFANGGAKVLYWHVVVLELYLHLPGASYNMQNVIGNFRKSHVLYRCVVTCNLY